MTEYRVNCKGVRDFSSFVTALNDGLIKPCGGNWKGSLDALNDCLSWPDQKPYVLVLLNSEQMPEVLGHRATVLWYKDMLETCHENNRESVAIHLSEAEACRGATLWHIVLEIFEDNAEYVSVRFEHTSNE